MDTSQMISLRIRQLCQERDITVGRLCSMAGTTGSTVSDIINGKTKNAGVLTIKKLCDALEISLAEFFDTEAFRNAEQEIQ